MFRSFRSFSSFRSLFVRLALLVVCAAGAAHAQAFVHFAGSKPWTNEHLVGSDPIFIELQLKAKHLLELIRLRLVEEDICPEVIELDGLEVVVDPPEFMPGGRIVQEGERIIAEIFANTPLRSLDCTDGYGACSFDHLLQSTVRIELSAEGTELCVQLDSIDVANVDDAGFDTSGIESWVAAVQDEGPFCHEIPSSQVSLLLGSGAFPTSSFLRFDPVQDRIALRTHFDHADWPNGLALQTGGPSDGHGGADWNVILSAGMLRQAMGTTFRQADHDNEIFKNTEWPTVTWRPLDTAGGLVETKVVGEVHGAGCGIGVDPLEIRSLFLNTPQPDTLALAVNAEWDAVDSDVLACALDLGFKSGFGGPMALPAITFTAALVADVYEVPGYQAPEWCHAVPGQEFALACEVEYDVPRLTLSETVGMPGIELRLDGVRGVDAGLSLIGTAEYVGSFGKAPLQTAMKPITFDHHGSCNDLSVGYQGTVWASGNGRVCGAEYDDHGVYSVTNTHASPWLPAEFELGFGGSTHAQSAFFADPQPLVLTLYTTAGTGTVHVPAPKEKPADVGLFSIEAIYAMEAWSDCQKLETGFLGIPGMFDIEWMIDPPPWHEVGFATRDPLLARTTFAAELIHIEIAALESRVPVWGNGATLDYGTVPAIATGSALLTTARGPAVAVPFTALIDLPLRGVPSADGTRVSLSLVASQTLLLDLDPSALPAGMTSATLPLQIDPAGIELSFAVSGQ